MIEKYIQVTKSKQKASDKENDRLNPSQYSLQKIFDKVGERYKESSPKELRIMITNLQVTDSAREVIISDLQNQIKQIKKEIRWLKSRSEKGKENLDSQDLQDPNIENFSYDDLEKEVQDFALQDRRKFLGESSGLKINLIDRIITQKWYVQITILIEEEFSVITEALIDSGADLNCLAKGLVPSNIILKQLKR